MDKVAVEQRIRDDTAAVMPFDELEQTHIADTLAWIDSGAQLFRLQAPDVPKKHLVAYFVLVDPEHQSVLLGDHIKAQLWLPSGGHVEQGELPVDTIRREAHEELRIPATFLRGNERPMFVTQTVTVGLTPGHTDVSLWYLLRGDVHQRLQFERAAYTDVAWFAITEILESHPAIFDQHMHRFTRKLQTYLQT